MHVHPVHTADQPSRRTLAAVIASALSVFVIDYAFIASGTVDRPDDDVIMWLHDHGTTGLDHVMTFVSDTGGVGRTVPVAMVAAFLLYTRRRLELGVFLVAIVAAQLTRYGLTALFPRERPGLFAGAQSGNSSFPSGHAFGSTLVYGLIASWMWWHRHRAAASAVAIWAVLVVFSRVYLGAHHPTDVIASVCLGLAFLAATIMVYEHLVASRSTIQPTRALC